MSYLVSDLIVQSFLDMGAIAAGETPTAAEYEDARVRLNQEIGSWSVEEFTVPVRTHGSFTLTAGTRDYTLGTGGTLVTAARPIRVTGASSVSGNFRKAVKVMSHDRFSREVEDPLASASVLATHLAADGSYPSINLRVHPMPATAPGTLWLDYWMAMATYAAITDAITLPDEITDALHFNLAVRLYPQYARAGGMDPVLAANAKSTKEALVARNMAILGQQAAPPAAEE